MNTNLPGNPYEVNPDDFDAASDCRTLDGDYATSDAILKEAQVKATLALAHEQRTMTLAYAAAHTDDPEFFVRINTDLLARLGLDQETPDADH